MEYRTDDQSDSDEDEDKKKMKDQLSGKLFYTHHMCVLNAPLPQGLLWLRNQMSIGMT